NKTGSDVLSSGQSTPTLNGTTNGCGFFLKNTSGVSLTLMQLNDFSSFAIYGNSVTGFSLTNSTINGTNGNNNAGNQEEGSIRFDNLFTSGTFPTAQITNSSISGGGTFNVWVRNSTNGSTLNRLTMSNNTFGLISSSIGNDNVGVTSSPAGTNTATVNVTLQDCIFLGTRSDFFETIANGNSTMDVVARRNKFQDGQAIIPGGGVALSIRGDNLICLGAACPPSATTPGTANVTFDLSCNRMNGGTANSWDTVGIFISKGNGAGNFSGAVVNNIIGPAKTGSNAFGLIVRSTGSGTISTLIQNNSITGYTGEGINLQNNDGSATMNATLYGNTLSGSPNMNLIAGLYIENGATAGPPADTSTLNLVVGSATDATKKNDFSAGDPSNAQDISIGNFSSTNVTKFNLSRNGSGSSDPTQILKDDNLNPATTTVGFNYGGPITPVNTLPTVPATPTTCTTVPLLFASGGVEAAESGSCGIGAANTVPVPVDATVPVAPTTRLHNTVLDKAELDALVAAAIARWEATGLTPEQLAAMRRVPFEVADLPSWYLGEASGSRIRVDSNGGGNGWFIDATPEDDAEFGTLTARTRLYTDPRGTPAGRIDLLTAILHELGHAAGLYDSYASPERDSVMYGYLTKGERRLPRPGEAVGATPGSVTGMHFLISPDSVGNVPTGHTHSPQVRKVRSSGVSRVRTALTRLLPTTTAHARQKARTVGVRRGTASAPYRTPRIVGNGRRSVPDNGRHSVSRAARETALPSSATTQHSALSTQHSALSTQHSSALPRLQPGARPVYRANAAVTPDVDAVIGTLPPGKSVTITFDATVNESIASTSVSNQGTVTADGSISVLTDDPADLTGSTDPTVTPIELRADLDVTKSDNPDQVIPGGNITYTIGVTNNATTGHDANVTVTDTIPTNTTLVSASVTTGTGWTRTDSLNAGDTGNLTFAKTGDVAPADAATFTVVVKVNLATAINTTITN
ncbi:MAG: hypothetical protein M3347_14960, partial [Armatimonadota bacterium]|nr:hypothetical protein [Armatimonadota bacterium]